MILSKIRTQRQQNKSSTDISRLLDPIYAAPNAYSSNSVYVDAHGELHDPDFHCFPVMHQKRTSHSTSRNTSRPHWKLCPDEVEEENELDHMSTAKYRPSHEQRYPSYDSNYPFSFTVEEEEESAPKPIRGVAQIIDRTKRGLHSRWSSVSSSSSFPDDIEGENGVDWAAQPPAEHEWKQTYNYKARRQWAAINECVRFGVFRAQRRFRQRNVTI